MKTQSVIAASIDLVGTQGKDRVTGFEGMVSSVSFDAYGCVQVALTPKVDPKTGVQRDGIWIDVKRFDQTSKKRLMENPFANPPAMGKEIGSAEKPATRW